MTPSTDLGALIDRVDGDAVATEALATWIGAQRWFGSKARDITHFKPVDLIVIADGPPPLTILIVEARTPAGTHELYQLPIAIRADAAWSKGVIDRRDGLAYYDALADPEQVALLARQFARLEPIEHGAAQVRFRWRDGEIPRDEPIRPVGVEQTNTSLAFDDRLMLKAYRRLEAGINPELEMLQFLEAHDFGNIARLEGWYEYSGELFDATLGVMQHYVPNARDGWTLALESITSEGPDEFLSLLGDLGVVTGEMHTALGSDPGDPDFAPEEPGAETVALITARIDEEIERVFIDLPDIPEVAPIKGRGEELRDRLMLLSHTGVGGALIRAHGDFHLGQTLLGEPGWVIIDFEGEPRRPLIERRRKRSPLRDVAGMLRSFAYVVLAARLLSGSQARSGWEAEAREQFLDGYLRAVDPSLLPAGRAAIGKLLLMFEMEKALYDLSYELNNRPDWVLVPVAAISRLLEEPL